MPQILEATHKGMLDTPSQHHPNYWVRFEPYSCSGRTVESMDYCTSSRSSSSKGFTTG